MPLLPLPCFHKQWTHTMIAYSIIWHAHVFMQKCLLVCMETLKVPLSFDKERKWWPSVATSKIMEMIAFSGAMVTCKNHYATGRRHLHLRIPMKFRTPHRIIERLEAVKMARMLKQRHLWANSQVQMLQSGTDAAVRYRYCSTDDNQPGSGFL